jgi:unsaturated rhamnogalacturonyl hydrolase
MKKKYSIIISVLLSGFFSLSLPVLAQDEQKTKTMLRIVVDAVLKDATFQFVDKNSGQHFTSLKKTPTDAQLRLESPFTDWRYWNGVLNIAMIRLSEILQERTYREYTKKHLAFCFDNYSFFEKKYNNEDKWNYPFGQFFIMEELDDCGAMGASVVELLHSEAQDRYRSYIEKTAHHIRTKQSRMEDGTLVRSFPQKWTIWADDLYMSISFLSRYAELSNDSRVFDDAAQQVINFHKYLFDRKTGLMYHCWYSDVKRPGVAFWGRANGWAMVAQVDLLDRLPKDHPQRDTLIALLQRHILGIARYQNGEGLWHQLIDKADSYLETSCSAMFTYAIARAVNKGYLESRYASIARQGWKGVSSKIRSDGKIEGVCTGTGIGDDLVHYYRRPTPLNDIHGIGAVLLAGSEILSLPATQN